MAPDRENLAEADPYILRLCVAALLLAVLLLAPRAWILHRFQFTAWPTDNAGLALVKLFVAGSYDAGSAAGVTGGFLLLLLLFRRKREAARLIYGCFLIIGVICAAAAVAHTRILAVLGHPFNYRWLYYSDFLRSIDSHEAVRAALQPDIAVAISSMVIVCYCAASV